MQQQSVTLTNQLGLHARPAAAFVQKANQYRAAVRIRAGEKEADAKSILSVLALGARQGSTVTLTADGPDEEQALAELAAFLAAGCGEA
ncbi:MAG TPA: HPr family phosphocarrier protein [Firmicutes bacterium]|jgi:phosphocarrier protein|nr:phosphocarrier protein NPr [Bacillota bacterium]HHV58399.1 HPr family phosphocarrier protein [Bacillota bacterium]